MPGKLSHAARVRPHRVVADRIAPTPGPADTDDGRAEPDRSSSGSPTCRRACTPRRSASLLVVLQGIDAAGKDSSVKHVFSGTNPQGVRVFTFKQPSNEELAHDFLWRYHQHTPAQGMIHVFNRSHYEDVLVVRVKGLVRGGALALAVRLDQRLRAHARARGHDDRQVLPAHLQGRAARALPRAARARGQALQVLGQRRARAAQLGRLPGGLRGRAERHTSTEWAPWHMVPADHKWYRNLPWRGWWPTCWSGWTRSWPEPEEDLEKFAAEELDQLSSR